MAKKLLQERKLFCERPSSRVAEKKARARWKALVQDEWADNAARFVQQPKRHFAALKAFYGSSPARLFDLVADDLTKFKRLIELVQTDVGHWRSKMMGMLVLNSLDLMSPQVFEGIVKSITEKHVMIEFKIGDDLDLRQFSWDDIDNIYKLSLEEGQAVRARCHLELIPPREPMSDNERKKWEKEHREARGYLKKAKPGRNLLEEDDE